MLLSFPHETKNSEIVFFCDETEKNVTDFCGIVEKLKKLKENLKNVCNCKNFMV